MSQLIVSTSIFEKIQQDRKELRKDPESTLAFSVLTLVVGEVETITKRDGSKPTDDKMISIIKKLIKSNNEVIALSEQSQSNKFVKENEILSSYIPVEMSREKLLQVIESIKETNLGAIMKNLNSNYAGKFDRGLASVVAKEYLERKEK